MGKTLALTSAIRYYASLASAKIRSWTTIRSSSSASASALLSSTPLITHSHSHSHSHRNRMDAAKDQEVRVPLSEVVADCVRRWFNEALKEARAGDTSMQVLVGQMYHSGYGVPKNDQKARAWIEKASRYRSSVWKVSDKRPGYNASDSDSDEEPDKK